MIGARRRPARHGVTRSWILPLGVLTGLISAALGGMLSRSLFLDLVAWWPAWLLVFLLARLAQGRKLGMVRLSGLVPLVGFALVVLFGIGHVQGWPSMASAPGRLIGPEVGDSERAGLIASIDGQLVVDRGATFLYEVTPIRWGGGVGLPDAVEETVDSVVSVTLQIPPDPGLQTFAGWNMRLSSQPVWELELRGDLQADLTGLAISELSLGGRGNVSIPAVQFLTPATVNGSFTVAIPASASVRVVGEAQVPIGWERNDEGWQSPNPGDGWVLTITPGSNVVIITPS